LHHDKVAVQGGAPSTRHSFSSPNPKPGSMVAPRDNNPAYVTVLNCTLSCSSPHGRSYQGQKPQTEKLLRSLKSSNPFTSVRWRFKEGNLLNHLLIYCKSIPSGLLMIIMPFLTKKEHLCHFLGHIFCRVPSICSLFYQSIHLSIYYSIDPSIYSLFNQSINRSIYSLFDPSNHPSIQSIYLFLFVYIYIYSVY
uniref:Uncharacterized protein n=1 Tax=Oryzias melastigma TaxID=30732 RepID=A0A3B3DVQ4_ORYME